MVLSEQARRNWRIAAIVCSTIAGVHATFFTSYNLPINQNDNDNNNDNEGHVFTPIHQWVHQQKVKWYNNGDNSNNTISNTNRNHDEELNSSVELMSSTTTSSSSRTVDPHLDNIAELRKITKGHR